MKIFFPTLLIVVVLTGCSSHLIQREFDDSLDAYNESLRWREWDSASAYAADSISDNFRTRAAAAKNVRVVDYRILSRVYDAEKREAIVVVEIDYYDIFSHTMRTLRDTQKWAYLEERGTHRWKLTSPLPEFR